MQFAHEKKLFAIDPNSGLRKSKQSRHPAYCSPLSVHDILPKADFGGAKVG
jgi:hypothetical protein